VVSIVCPSNLDSAAENKFSNKLFLTFISVKESSKRVDPEMDDERRIYYQITGVGAKALAAELKRYKDFVRLAQKRKLYPKILACDV
jgi:hypothetical protein